MSSVDRDRTLRDILLIGYIAGIFYTCFSLLAYPYYVSHNIYVFDTLEGGLWLIISLLVIPPVLSMSFYKISTISKKYSVLWSVLVSFLLILGVIFAQLVTSGLLIDLSTYSIQYYAYISFAALVLGFMFYGIWTFSFEIYQKYIIKSL